MGPACAKGKCRMAAIHYSKIGGSGDASRQVVWQQYVEVDHVRCLCFRQVFMGLQATRLDLHTAKILQRWNWTRGQRLQILLRDLYWLEILYAEEQKDLIAERTTAW